MNRLAVRAAARSCARCYSTQPFQTPAHAGLFWREAEKDNFLLSFLPDVTGPPSFTDIGSNHGKELSPRSFEPSDFFVPLVHEILSARYEQSILLQTLAKTRGEGYINLSDERNPPEVNRQSTPDDILASVYVKDGKLQPGTYEAMPSYRLVTVDGMMRLNAELHKYLVDGLRLARQLEVQGDGPG